jgi:hypothetical protein
MKPIMFVLSFVIAYHPAGHGPAPSLQTTAGKNYPGQDIAT